MDALLVLTNIALLLLLGLLFSFIAKKIRFPNILLMLLLGVLFGALRTGLGIFDFPEGLLVGVGMLALAAIVFNTFSRLDFKEMDEKHNASFKYVSWIMLFSIPLITIITAIFFYGNLEPFSLIYSLVFSILMICIDPHAFTFLYKEFIGARVSKIREFLHREYLIGAWISILVPFIILEFLSAFQIDERAFLLSIGKHLPLFLSQVACGIGAGFVVGIIIFKYMKRFYSHHFSPVVVFVAMFLAYFLAEILNGDGIVGIAVVALIFANIDVKEKHKLREFNLLLAKSMEIFIFLLIGIVAQVDFSFGFIAASLGLFALLLLARVAAVFIGLHKDEFPISEKWFVALNMPKGLNVAAIALVFSFSPDPSMKIILDLILAFLIYSLLLAYIVDLFSARFFKDEPMTEPSGIDRDGYVMLSAKNGRQNKTNAKPRAAVLLKKKRH